jgi:flagellar biosynthesis/type III secretory pathway protein FliH
LFNQTQTARAAVPWQPNAGISQKLSSRGYATTSWTEEEAAAFADVGYPAKTSGFSADHYQPMKQPLTQQAQASLALLEGEYRNEQFGEEKPASQDSTATNAHLPFVMDSFAATRKSKLGVQVDAGVLKRAIAQAELAETLQLSRITSDEALAAPIVIHPDQPDAPNALELMAEMPEASEVTVALEAPVVVELPTVAGMALEEVAQREAEQFAKGLAQAREEAETALIDAVEKAKAQALAQGIEQGMAQGISQGFEQGKAEGLEQGIQQGLEQGIQQGLEKGLEQGREEGREEGKALGLSEGEEQARQAAAEEMAAQRVVFENAAQELHALIDDPKKFFEPLKRLALHVAEQVVLGELQTSSTAIERLVQRCLDELDHPVHGAVVLELNPADKERLLAQGSEMIKGMRLEAMADMKPGSVRVFANDTVVQDLVEHRLASLAQGLQVDEAAWRDKSPLLKPELDVEEKTEDGDVYS